MAAETLQALHMQFPQVRLVQLNAGDKRNALPREALASICVRFSTNDLSKGIHREILKVVEHCQQLAIHWRAL